MALKNLSNRLQKRIEKIADNSRVVKKVATAVLESLVENTPVDTSKAISNYQVSIGVPKTNVREAFFPGKRGLTKSQSGAETIKRGKAVIETRKNGEDIYIVNNAPYVAELDSDDIHTPFIKPAILKGKRVARNGWRNYNH